MARKALLIGAETGDLTGVANDVTAMAEALGRWGFTSTRCEEENAGRAGILDAYERLIGQARPDDAIVVYYSGHGAYARDPDRGPGTPGPRTIQLIVPTDIDDSAEGDFRGITAAELSVLLARLTERTRNVTVVLDCCHAAHMSRDPDRVVKALPRAIPEHLIRSHLDALRREGLALDLWQPPGNPHAVRVVACAPEQQACEDDNADGVRMGYLTDALTRALTELRDSGLTLTWDTVVDRVRQQVLGRWAAQRPEVEGPARRVVFDVAEADPVATLPVSREWGRVRIPGASLLGVRPGDGFVVMPDDAPEPDDDRKLGDVRVDRVDAQAAYGVLVPRRPDLPVALDPEAPLPLGARAHLVRSTLPALPVRIAGDDPRLAALARAVEPVTLVRVAGDAEPAPVRVEAGADGLTIHDAAGPLHTPRPADPAGTARLVGDLKRLAQAHALRCLTEDPGLALGTPVSIRLARVVDGVPVPLPRSGAVLHAGQSICVTVRNEGRDTVYVSLLDIGISARISVLYPSSPSGVRLDPGQEYVFGSDDLTGALPGMAVTWPASVPGDRPRPETIVVLVSAEPTDTRFLEQRGIGRGAAPSRLERHLRQLGAGAREVVPATARRVRFALRPIDFDLAPTPAPPAETAVFQVDDRPRPAATLEGHRPGAGAALTLRLSDLVVHHNRAFRCADIRLDALVVTDDAAGRPECHVHTERFTDIGDGERLTGSGTPVFRGTARGRLDVAVWVSPAGGAGVDLAALLRAEAAAAPAGPRAASVLVDAAHRVLRDALGQTTGLYRNTLLAAERFGVTHLAGEFAVRAQDFSFRCTVAEESRPLPGGPSEQG